MINMVNPDKYTLGLFKRVEDYTDKVRKYYVIATDALLALSAKADLKPDELFSFADNPKLHAEANEILRGLYSAVYSEIQSGVEAEWGLANISCDELIASIFGEDVMSDNHFARWFGRNQEAMDAFFTRKSSKHGLNLSQKVWKYTGMLRQEMELALSVSLGQGDSAATVSRKVRQYLQEPDKLFRRVRDADGNLKLSKAAKAYNPGQGVYRSSYKNAMRVSRTEINMAYREADFNRWQSMDFVVGIKVQRSKNYKEACECDIFAGLYPKGFLFRGWHPHCLCYATPVLATMDEMMKMQKQILNGEPLTIGKANEVKSVPAGFNDWIVKNKDTMDRRQSVPYFVLDNAKYV